MATLLYLFRKIIGLGITIFAVSQGAPFWFDLLNKLSNLRYGGKPPDVASAQSASDTSLATLIGQLNALNVKLQPTTNPPPAPVAAPSVQPAANLPPVPAQPPADPPAAPNSTDAANTTNQTPNG